eukprot:6479479-Amphidinium_carterae.1
MGGFSVEGGRTIDCKMTRLYSPLLVCPWGCPGATCIADLASMAASPACSSLQTGSSSAMALPPI